MEKRALITGINGFVGHYLKNELEQNGYVVFGLGTEAHEERERYFQADITNKKHVEEAVKEIKPEYIFHLAGIGVPASAEQNRTLIHSVNVLGTRNILDAALFSDSIPKILVVSSAYVYGDPLYLPIDEKHPLNGKGPYAESRIQQEEMISAYMDTLPLIVTRSFNHTGPRQSDTFVIPKIVKQALEVQKGLRRELTMGNMEVKRDITHVQDVAHAYRLLLEQPRMGIVSNVCRGESIALKDIVEYVRVLTHCNEMPVAVNPDFMRSNDAPDIYGSTALLRTLIDWQPRFDYQAMVADVYHFWSQLV